MISKVVTGAIEVPGPGGLVRFQPLVKEVPEEAPTKPSERTEPQTRKPILPKFRG